MCSIPGLPTPGAEVPVLITRVNLNPGCGFVELWVNMADERKHIYEQMREEIQTPHRKFSGSEGKPEDLCLVCISETWHRARIVSIESETYNLFLIDQGQPHKATNEVLAWAQSDSFLLPPETECCILANILSFEKNWSDRAAKFLMSLHGKKFEGLVQQVLMPDRIILLDIPVVSKHMCKSGVAKKVPVEEFKILVLKWLHLPKDESFEALDLTEEQSLNVSSQRNQYFYPELLTDTLETANVTEVIDPENIFCELRIFSKAVKTLSEQIHQYYEENSDFGEELPQSCGDPCAAKGTNGRWHRSLLKQNMETCTGVVEVLHVDEGKNDLVPVENIRPLHGNFLRMPVVTYLCSLSGIKENGIEWTAEQMDFLKSLLNKTVVVKFDCHDVLQDLYHVTLFAANGACINSCFLEKAGFIPPSLPEQDLIVQNKPMPLTCSCLLGDEQCVDLKNKVSVFADGLPEETLPSSRNEAVKSGKEHASPPHTSDICMNASSERLDPAIDCNGYPAPGFSSELQNEWDGSAFTVGSSVNVKVSCIESLHKFWCQTTKSEDSLRCLMQDLQNHYSSIHPQPLVESICVARNPDNDMWYRAKIIANTHLPVVDVRFIDYGQTQKVLLRDVYPIDPAFLGLNEQAFQCCLFSLKSPTNPTPTNIWNSNALTEFHNFVDLKTSSNFGLKCVIKAVASDEEGLLLNMVDIETDSDGACEFLAKKCIQSEVHVHPPPHVTSDVCNYSTYNIDVGAKENVWITFSETVNHFYCQLDRNAKLFDKVRENIAQLLSQPQRSNQPLGLNSLCFARYTDNEWYRAQVVEMSPKFKVHFVDFGDTLAVNETDIRPFPAEASVARSIPVQAVPLGLFDVPAELPQEVNQWFADRAVGHSFTISVVAKGKKGKLIVELYEGSVNVNMNVKKRIAKMKRNKMTGIPQQADQHHSNNSTEGRLAQESVLMKTPNQNGVHSNNAMCAADDLRSSKFTANVPAPKTEGATVLDKGIKPTLHVTLEDKTATETSIQICHSDSERTQYSHSCPEENLTILKYKWPNLSQKQIDEVYASCIVGPHYFWCQYHTEDLNIISMLAQETGQPSFPEMLVPGNPCLALFSSDNNWYRAQVIQKTDSTLNVLFIDYGNESEVNIKDVRAMSHSLLEIPPQAFLCYLKGFDESKGSWDDEVYDHFYNLVVDKPLKVTVFNKENHSEIAVPQYAVNVECDKMLINSLVQKNWKLFSVEKSKNDSNQTQSFPQNVQTEGNTTHFNAAKENGNTCMYKKPQLSQNHDQMVYASCIVDPFYFWCQYADTEALCKVSQLAQAAGQEQQDMMLHETLDIGSPCLALYSDNQWYRAQVIDKAEDTLRVVFIDYGNESEVDIRNIRPLSQSLLNKPPQAFLCCLGGFQESEGSWDDAIYEEFYSLLIDKPLKLKVLSIGEHSEIRLPQYRIEIECEGVAVNSLMQKYWKGVDTDGALAESLESVDLDETRTEQESDTV